MDQRAPILHKSIPRDQVDRAAARLPSVAPVRGPWLTCDDVYGAQMAERRRLMEVRLPDVYAQLPAGLPAARAFLQEVLDVLPDGFEHDGGRVRCPDGFDVELDRDAPLRSLGLMLQQDICILEKQGAEHVLTGAILCFPASWTLSQKIGRPLIRIHAPVDDYGASIAARVQRLFDGVKAGQPLWRANHLRYDDPALFQPRPENDPRPISTRNAGYVRSERQTILRLQHPGAVAFVIHTSVVQLTSEDEDGDSQKDRD